MPVIPTSGAGARHLLRCSRPFDLAPCFFRQSGHSSILCRLSRDARSSTTTRPAFLRLPSEAPWTTFARLLCTHCTPTVLLSSCRCATAMHNPDLALTVPCSSRPEDAATQQPPHWDSALISVDHNTGAPFRPACRSTWGYSWLPDRRGLPPPSEVRNVEHLVMAAITAGSSPATRRVSEPYQSRNYGVEAGSQPCLADLLAQLLII